MNSERQSRDPKSSRRSEQTLVIGRKLDDLATCPKEFDRRQMKGIERPHGDGKRIKSAGEDRRGKFDQCHAANEASRLLGVRAPQSMGMQARPCFVLKQAAGDERLLP